MNSSRIILLTILLVGSLALFLPSVHAQTTRIVMLRNPLHVVAGGNEPFSVQAVVAFQDSPAGSTLVVGILDMGSMPQKIVPGIIPTASPDQCVNQPSLQALCVMKLPSSSGNESLEFRIGGLLGGQPRGLGTWNLNFTAGLFDSNNALIAGSVSSVPFGVNLLPIGLRVNVPDQVTVTIDGVQQRPGAVTVGVPAGSHNVSVAPIAYVDNGTRLSFVHWSDGSTDLNRTVTLQSSSTYEADYLTQYLLTLESEQGAVSGQGWYDANSSATFSASQVEPMSGFLGSLGGKVTLQGWYENGTLLTNSTSGSIIMNQAYTLTVRWQADYSMPIVIIVAIVVVIALVIAFVIRRRAASGAPDKARPKAQEPKRGSDLRSRQRPKKSTTRRTR